MRLLRAIALLSLASLLAGCETVTHRVRIEATTNPLPPEAPKPQSFWIKSRQADPRIETLRYHEAIGHIKTALSGRGLYEAPSEATADMVIEVDYGSAPKRALVEIDEPRTERKRTAKAGEAAPKAGEAAASPDAPATDADRTPQRGELMIDVSVFRKHLTLEARHNREKAGADMPEFLWRVRVENEGESNDLRKFVPILASATIDYIASETGGERELTIDEQGQDVKFVKKGM